MQCLAIYFNSIMKYQVSACSLFLVPVPNWLYMRICADGQLPQAQAFSVKMCANNCI